MCGSLLCFVFVCGSYLRSFPVCVCALNLSMILISLCAPLLLHLYAHSFRCFHFIPPGSPPLYFCCLFSFYLVHMENCVFFSVCLFLTWYRMYAMQKVATIKTTECGRRNKKYIVENSTMMKFQWSLKQQLNNETKYDTHYTHITSATTRQKWLTIIFHQYQIKKVWPMHLIAVANIDLTN